MYICMYVEYTYIYMCIYIYCICEQMCPENRAPDGPLRRGLKLSHASPAKLSREAYLEVHG